MNQNLLILGSGRLGAIAQEIAKEMDCFKQITYLSDPQLSLSQLEALSIEHHYGIAAVEPARLRLRLNQKLESCCYVIPTLLHPSTSVSRYASIGKGCMLEPGVVIEGESRIGDAVILRAGSIVGSYTLIGEGSSLGIRSVLLEGAILPPETVVQAGAILKGITGKERAERKEEKIC